MQQVLIHQSLLKRLDLSNLKSNVDKLQIGNWEMYQQITQFEK